eukprot:gene15550-21643_t
MDVRLSNPQGDLLIDGPPRQPRSLQGPGATGTIGPGLRGASPSPEAPLSGLPPAGGRPGGEFYDSRESVMSVRCTPPPRAIGPPTWRWLLSLVLMQATKNGNDLWLSYWVAGNQKQPSGLPAPPGIGHSPLATLTGWNPLLTSSREATGQLRSTPARRQGSHRDSLVLPLPELWRDWREKEGHAFHTDDYGTTQTSPPTRPSPQNIPAPSRCPPPPKAPPSAFEQPPPAQPAPVQARPPHQGGVGAEGMTAFSFASAGLHAARSTHSKLLTSVLGSPMRFFDITPAGRVLNRSSSDVSKMYDTLPFVLTLTLTNLFFGFLRFSSDVYSAFGEAVEAAPSIRAFKAQSYFLNRQNVLLTAYQRAAISGVASGTVQVLHQLLASSLVTAVAVCAVLSHEGYLPGGGSNLSASLVGLSLAYALPLIGGSNLSASLVGLSLAYALPLIGVLDGLLTSSAETEQEMVAVERVFLEDNTPSQESNVFRPSPPQQAESPTIPQ